MRISRLHLMWWLCCLFLLAAERLEAVEVLGRAELSEGWKLASAKDVPYSGASVSLPSQSTEGWYPIQKMPATVLDILQKDGVYPNLYFGMNLLTEVPQDLYKQDWWYRTEFELPQTKKVRWLEFHGINYRAEIWFNGRLLADSSQAVGMYVTHEFNVSELARPGEKNVLAIKVTPERAIPDASGVELADSWHDWLDWKYLGSRAPKSDHYKEGWTADRNAGVWKAVYLHETGSVKLSGALVNSDLPLPALDSAKLTIYATATNATQQAERGVLSGVISRDGKENIQIEQEVSLSAGETKEIAFSSDKFALLNLQHPDLWWPYTMGNPSLYRLHLEFHVQDAISDGLTMRFGIRKVTQHRDTDLRFSKTPEGNFYLKVNGKDFHVRGADYTPDLLFNRDSQRDAETIQYVKDLGLNMLRWELKIADEHIFELADQEGIPVMAGWMCCSKWEQWPQWSEEDQRVARESLRSQIVMLRPHASVFLWSNGSDGLPPEPLRSDYRQILHDLRWQNAIVDTDGNGNRDSHGRPTWDGIGMTGVDRWHPPSYWFSAKYPAAAGSSAEYGDNEVIPPYESLKKFIPQEKLWPINEFWFFHAGAHEGANQLATIRQVVDRRYGVSSSAEEFARKAQLAHYENTRAQFEDWAANSWSTHKMEMYWMLNNHWPSFFGHLFDYYMEAGGGYFGAKKALRPVSIVFDYYATKNHKQAKITITNQLLEAQYGLRVRVRIYDLNGTVRYDNTATNEVVPSQGTTLAMLIPRVKKITPAYFVRCELFDSGGSELVDNVYWQSATLDELGNPAHDDDDYVYSQAHWADFTSLNTMPRVALDAVGVKRDQGGRVYITATLHNPSKSIAFFERVSVISAKGGEEILPILYSDNYVTIFPGETALVHADFSSDAKDGGELRLRIEGYNTFATEVSIDEENRN